MKQFIICLGITLMTYFIGASLNGVFNPLEWKVNEGNLFLHIFFIVIWLCPIMLNYLNGEKNFE